MEALDDGTRVARGEGLIAETLGEETVMLDPQRDTYLRLNRSGGLLWSRLAEPATVGELAQRLADAAGIDLQEAREDTLRFVAQMLDHGAIRVVSPEGR
jgi:hypothetical protein